MITDKENILNTMDTTTQNSNDWNQLLINNINDLSGWIKESGDKVGSFVSEQTPLLIQEYLNWIFISNVTSLSVICLGMIIPALVFLVIKKSFQQAWDDEVFNSSVPIFVVCCVVFGFSFLGFLVVGNNNISNIVKVKTAPRVIILEKMKELTRK